ncbi:MAG: lysophospholipid acyltransferase family protein [Nannocystaceae bacterium]
MHPIARSIRATLTLAIRVFFRRVELAGLERVPLDGPVIFVLNHPNGLIDPVFLLCLAPRPVSYIGKATLFTMPVIGYLVRAFDTLPVQRKQDRATGVDNSETFARARELLSGGGSLGIFPEGVSHNEPRLQKLKTGAARIALGTGLEGLRIVPAGLYYSDKAIFRSEALVLFGAPLEVDTVPLGDDGEAPRDAVRALTDRIEAALGEVTLQADAHEALALVDRAARILAAGDEGEPRLGDAVSLRQRLVAGYDRLRVEAPAEVAALVERLRDYEAESAALGLGLDHAESAALSAGVIARVGLRSLAVLLLLAPVALVGTLVHYPAYRAVGVLATRLSKGDDDLVATIKVLGALLLFPLSWILAGVAAGVGLGLGLALGVAVALALPLTGLGALEFWERLERLAAGARLAWVWLTRRSVLERLAGERRAIHAGILELAARLGEV